MKLKEVLSALKPFASIAAPFIPGGSAIVSAVNAFLPDSKKLPENAKGEEILSAIDQLPEDKKAQLLEKQINLEVVREENWTERYVAMVKADSQSTRPKIALIMAWLVVIESIVFISFLSYSVYTSGISSLNQPYLWTVFGVLTGIPSGILGKYFGELRREQANRLGIQNTNPVLSWLQKFK